MSTARRRGAREAPRKNGQKERGTCSNTTSVRKGPLEKATLSILQHQLVTEDHARLFADEFGREMGRLADATMYSDQAYIDRLIVVQHEIDNLAANMLSRVCSPTLVRLLDEREAEKVRLAAQIGKQTRIAATATILPHSALLRRFEEKVAKLCETLNDETVRGEAAEILSTLIESVTIYPDGEHGPEAEVVAWRWPPK